MRADLRFKLPEEALAKSVSMALKKGKKNRRCITTINVDGDELRILFDAKDTTALRASANSNLRIFDMLINVWEVVRNAR